MVKFKESFLTPEQCEYFISLIEKQNVRSAVASGEKHTEINDYRTSSTSNFDPKDKAVAALHKKIADTLGLDIKRGENLQGQLYEPGQYFKEHTDFFHGESYNSHCLSSGNRIKTLMIYLNEDCKGGQTDFKRLGITFKPKVGRALVWDNMIDGEFNHESLHEGMPVEEGKKYIITSWWRENDWNPDEDAKLAAEYYNKKQEPKVVSLKNKKKKKYTTKDDLPKLTETGFKVVKCPDKVWGLIKDAYELLKLNKTKENWEGIGHFIKGGETPTEMMSFDNLTSLKDVIHKELLPLHEEFCGEKLIPTMLYGIRSYNKEATLINHLDRLTTHHVSSIVIVDKDLDCGCNQTKGVENDWPLDFQDHNGEWHKVYAEIGDIILYESATCLHGREEPFKGNWFRNFYVHYMLENYEFEAK